MLRLNSEAVRFADNELELSDGDSLRVDRVVALPALEVPVIPGLPQGEGGFVVTDMQMHASGLDAVWAVGDVISFPVKQGGLAAQQANVAARAIAASAGAQVPLQGHLTSPCSAPHLITGGALDFLRVRIEEESAGDTGVGSALWSPPEKLAGNYLGPVIAHTAGMESPQQLVERPSPHDASRGADCPAAAHPLPGCSERRAYQALLATIEQARRVIHSRVVWHVNSTHRGGGVAEMLRSLLPYVRGAGVDTRWVVLRDGPDFFAVTKRIHNNLHGDPGDGGGLGAEEREIYEETLAESARHLTRLLHPGDVVYLHDPQTAGLVPAVRDGGVRVVWRCHIGIDEPNEPARRAWSFLRPYVEQADAYVFSRRQYLWEGLDAERAWMVPPSVDPFSPKNQEMEPATVEAILGESASGLTSLPRRPSSPVETAVRAGSSGAPRSTRRSHCPRWPGWLHRCLVGTA